MKNSITKNKTKFESSFISLSNGLLVLNYKLYKIKSALEKICTPDTAGLGNPWNSEFNTQS